MSHLDHNSSPWRVRSSSQRTLPAIYQILRISSEVAKLRATDGVVATWAIAITGAVACCNCESLCDLRDTQNGEIDDDLHSSRCNFACSRACEKWRCTPSSAGHFWHFVESRNMHTRRKHAPVESVRGVLNGHSNVATLSWAELSRAERSGA